MTIARVAVGSIFTAVKFGEKHLAFVKSLHTLIKIQQTPFKDSTHPTRHVRTKRSTGHKSLIFNYLLTESCGFSLIQWETSTKRERVTNHFQRVSDLMHSLNIDM